jgi:hypothetical protein
MYVLVLVRVCVLCARTLSVVSMAGVRQDRTEKRKLQQGIEDRGRAGEEEFSFQGSETKRTERKAGKPAVY